MAREAAIIKALMPLADLFAAGRFTVEFVILVSIFVVFLICVQSVARDEAFVVKLILGLG